MSTYISKNAFLTESEMTTNARFVYTYMTARGWSPTAVCGMLGNMETESTINSGIWQNLDAGNTSLGFGLVQWTPATKYLSWCSARGLEPSAMESALARIEWEVENGEQFYPTDDYPLTFREFKTSGESASYLAWAFLRNYERPADQNQPARASQAEKWYNLLKGSEGSDPVVPDIPSPPSNHPRESKLPLWLIISATRR